MMFWFELFDDVFLFRDDEATEKFPRLLFWF